MAIELPYFKFIATEWLTGSIALEPLEVQGLFINICALYWKNGGVLSVSEIEKRYRKKTVIANLTERFISVNDGYVSINFLDEQLTKRQYVSVKNKENGKKGGKPTHKKNIPNGKRDVTETLPKLTNKEEEKEEEREKEKEQDMPSGSYQKFLQIYSGWYHKKVGVKIAFDGMQGKALKKIITFLIANSKEKNSEGGAAAWEYILEHWQSLEPFYQDQLKVNQIQSNLPNILNQLKNGTSKGKPKNDRGNIHNIIDAMFSEPEQSEFNQAV